MLEVFEEVGYHKYQGLDPNKTKPIGNAILVEILGNIDETRFRNSVIVIPDKKHMHPWRVAKAIKVGKGKWSKKGVRLPMEVKEGNYLLITGYSGSDGKAEGKYAGKYQLITEDDVIAIIEDEDLIKRFEQ